MLKSKAALMIKKIWQVDNYTFAVEWQDGQSQSYRLNKLQRHCPCAGCVDESTGKRKASDLAVTEDVRAVHIKSVGQYALRIQFTSGCSTGIYTFDLLRALQSL